MKIARYRSEGRPHYGIVEGDTIIECRGTPFRGQLERTNKTHPVSSVTLLPVSNPVQVFGGVGANYQDHIAQAEETSGRPLGSMGIQPFPKSNASLTGSGSPIVLIPEADEVHFEGEMVIVVGRKARKVSKERALDYVLGYTCGNDVSEKASWEKDFSHWRSKGVPSWGPVGPYIATGGYVIHGRWGAVQFTQREHRLQYVDWSNDEENSDRSSQSRRCHNAKQKRPTAQWASKAVAMSFATLAWPSAVRWKSRSKKSSRVSSGAKSTISKLTGLWSGWRRSRVAARSGKNHFEYSPGSSS